jgi:hypothetical protein
MKYIKQLSVILALMLFVTPSSAQTQSPTKRLTIEKLVDEFEIAYVADTLETLDAKYPNRARMRVVIEYQTIDPEIKVFKTFRGFGQWLRGRETDPEGMPVEAGTTIKLPRRVTILLVGCKRGLCTYDFDGGILHNHLYIKKISYGYRKGRPYIKTIFLLSG